MSEAIVSKKRNQAEEIPGRKGNTYTVCWVMKILIRWQVSRNLQPPVKLDPDRNNSKYPMRTSWWAVELGFKPRWIWLLNWSHAILYRVVVLTEKGRPHVPVYTFPWVSAALGWSSESSATAAPIGSLLLRTLYRSSSQVLRKTLSFSPDEEREAREVSEPSQGYTIRGCRARLGGQHAGLAHCPPAPQGWVLWKPGAGYISAQLPRSRSSCFLT